MPVWECLHSSCVYDELSAKREVKANSKSQVSFSDFLQLMQTSSYSVVPVDLSFGFGFCAIH